MTDFDLTPLMRSVIGLERYMSLVDSARNTPSSSDSYPPYNIEQHGEDHYRIVMAVAGFEEEDLTISVQDNTLKILGKALKDKTDITYLYRGIAGRVFERQFQLADFIKVGEAVLKNGLLCVDLYRKVPESMKPTTIQINKPAPKGKLIEQK